MANTRPFCPLWSATRARQYDIKTMSYQNPAGGTDRNSSTYDQVVVEEVSLRLHVPVWSGLRGRLTPRQVKKRAVTTLTTRSRSMTRSRMCSYEENNHRRRRHHYRGCHPRHQKSHPRGTITVAHPRGPVNTEADMVALEMHSPKSLPLP